MNKKNQHYVPQFYLRRFAIEPQEPNRKESNRAKKIFVFDKDNFQSGSYLKHIKKVASSQDFYKLRSINNLNKLGQSPQDLNEPDLNEFEDLLGIIENQAADFLAVVNFLLKDPENEKKEAEKLKDLKNEIKELKEDLSEFLVLQSARTLKMRKIILESTFDVYDFFNLSKGYVEEYLRKTQNESLQRYLIFFETFKKQSVTDETTKLNVPLLHYAFFYLSIYLVSEKFTNRKWEVGVNQTNIPFCTSDHPVAISPPSKRSPYSKGTEILFPVNPKLILILTNEKVTSEDCCIVHLDENQVQEYNKLQFYSSEQYIFSKNNNFEWAKQICNSITS